MEMPDLPSDGDSSAEDDWAAALAEQAEIDQKAAAAAAKKAAEVERDPLASPMANVKTTVEGNAVGAAALFKQFNAPPTETNVNGDIQMILDIPVQLTVELGRTKIPIKHILQLAQGSVIELDGLAGEPMDVLVNGCLIAQGEVVVVNEKFGIRLTDIITPSERIRRLNR
jgi:flagellar motor switch protein FliN/FliY